MHNIYHDIEIKSDPHSILDSITTPKGLNAWWTVKSSGDIKLGNSFQFYFSDDYNWYAQIVQFEENKLVQFQMTDADEDWMHTILTFDIHILEGHKNLLRFSHEGWKNTNAHFRRTSFCWALYLNGLKKYLEEGIIIPYSKRGSQ